MEFLHELGWTIALHGPAFGSLALETMQTAVNLARELGWFVGVADDGLTLRRESDFESRCN